jgi:hypothetical protein
MEDNRLIAEFMGIESYKSTKYTMFVYEENNHRTDVDLHYHTSWDWLMPVIHSILNYKLEIYNQVFYDFSMAISEPMYHNDISKAHSIVVTFIKDLKE